ncbi:SAM-dependent methyltransferase [Dactylosporangium sp. NPDC051484]|uniref:SAM-dependent methyltransferase n=1 Tax=Dactylosporangium sp. NPDC051484 TaxID=3154942 RepID=UPI00344E9607
MTPGSQNTLAEDAYQRRTATPGTVRTREEVERLFTGLDILDPGVVRAQPAGPDGIRAGTWAGIGGTP